MNKHMTILGVHMKVHWCVPRFYSGGNTSVTTLLVVHVDG